jgi:hypothetical protein
MKFIIGTEKLDILALCQFQAPIEVSSNPDVTVVLMVTHPGIAKISCNDLLCIVR